MQGVRRGAVSLAPPTALTRRRSAAIGGSSSSIAVATDDLPYPCESSVDVVFLASEEKEALLKAVTETFALQFSLCRCDVLEIFSNLKCRNVPRGEILALGATGQFCPFVFVKKGDVQVLDEDITTKKIRVCRDIRVGGYFGGGGGLLCPLLPTQTLVTAADCQLWMISASALSNLLVRMELQSRRTLEKAVRSHKLLSKLTAEEVAVVVDAFQERCFQPEEIVVEKGTCCDEMCVILHGSAIGCSGKQRNCSLGAGVSLCENALSGSIDCPLTAVAQERCCVAFLHRKTLKKLVKSLNTTTPRFIRSPAGALQSYRAKQKRRSTEEVHRLESESTFSLNDQRGGKRQNCSENNKENVLNIVNSNNLETAAAAAAAIVSSNESQKHLSNSPQKTPVKPIIRATAASASPKPSSSSASRNRYRVRFASPLSPRVRLCMMSPFSSTAENPENSSSHSLLPLDSLATTSSSSSLLADGGDGFNYQIGDKVPVFARGVLDAPVLHVDSPSAVAAAATCSPIGTVTPLPLRSSSSSSTTSLSSISGNRQLLFSSSSSSLASSRDTTALFEPIEFSASNSISGEEFGRSSSSSSSSFSSSSASSSSLVLSSHKLFINQKDHSVTSAARKPFLPIPSPMKEDFQTPIILPLPLEEEEEEERRSRNNSNNNSNNNNNNIHSTLIAVAPRPSYSSPSNVISSFLSSLSPRSRANASFSPSIMIPSHFNSNNAEQSELSYSPLRVDLEEESESERKVNPPTTGAISIQSHLFPSQQQEQQQQHHHHQHSKQTGKKGFFSRLKGGIIKSIFSSKKRKPANERRVLSPINDNNNNNNNKNIGNQNITGKNNSNNSNNLALFGERRKEAERAEIGQLEEGEMIA